MHDHNVGTCSSQRTEHSSPEGSACCGSGIELKALTPAEQAATKRGRSFFVEGLDCAEEIAILNKVVGPVVGGADNLIFDAINAKMTVVEQASHIGNDAIIKAVQTTGMSAKIWDDESVISDRDTHLKRQKIATIISGLMWICGIGFHAIETGMAGAIDLFSGHTHADIPPAELALFAAAIIAGIWLVGPKAYASAKRLSPDMNLLMVIAVVGAIAIAEFFEAATVSFLFALSLYLESWSLGRARNAVSSLLDLAPPTALVRNPDGSEEIKDASEITPGEVFIVRAGDRIALDAEVIEGAGGIDQSPITGESALVLKEVGDSVYAGTINGEGTLALRCTQGSSDTVLAKIISLINDAQSRRAEVEQWVAKFARIYTPIVMVLATLIALVPPLILSQDFSTWLYRALVLLVIACPCALVISTPVSIIAGLTAAARSGVLIKGGAYVELPGKTDVLALDKTGTITEGKPEVSAVYQFGTSSQVDVLEIAARLEMHSSHPLGDAIVSYARDHGAKHDEVRLKELSPASESRAVAGRGVEGVIDQVQVWVGSQRFATEKGFGAELEPILGEVESKGATLVAVGTDTEILGAITLSDRVRPGAAQAIRDLVSAGVGHIVMLTGDNKQSAAAVAKAVGIEDVRAELLPQDKLEAVTQLAASGKVVAMIGDGINDAPAMAASHYAIAMGAVGADAAIETADIALMTDDISKVPWLVKHSRKTMGVIRQNIAISLITKLSLVIATGFGLTSMWAAIASDVGISLIVIANALRLLKEKS